MLCTVFWSHTLKVTKTAQLWGTRAFQNTSSALVWISLRFHDLMLCFLWCWIPRWQSCLKNVPGATGMKGCDAYEIGFSGDGIKRFDLCFSVWNAGVKQVWTLHLDKMTQRHVSVCIFDSKKAGRAYVFFFHDSLSVVWTMSHTHAQT